MEKNKIEFFSVHRNNQAENWYSVQRSAVCDVLRWYNLERSDIPAQNMGVATNGSETAYCVLCDVALIFLLFKRDVLH
jgi:hypothetical protein